MGSATFDPQLWAEKNNPISEIVARSILNPHWLYSVHAHAIDKCCHYKLHITTNATVYCEIHVFIRQKLVTINFTIYRNLNKLVIVSILQQLFTIN